MRLFYYMNKPWKLSVAAAIISGFATILLTAWLFGPPDTRTLVLTLLISTFIAIPVSYLIGAMFLTYHRLLERRNQELEVINAELNAFAHTVAHDLKSPLFNLMGYVETMQIFLPDIEPEELKETLNRMQRSGQTMYQIIQDLLLLAETRNDEVPSEPLNMTQIIQRSQEQLRIVIEQAQAEIHLPEQWPVALGYAPWVEAVWVNYLSNGLKYSGDPPVLRLGAAANGNGEVEFWVQDNGPGISADDQQRLFNEFTRLEQGRMRAKGSGLGLSIVQRIVTRLGGRVGVESQPGHGSRFYFTLPEHY